MEKNDASDGFAALKARKYHLKKHLRRFFDNVAVGVKDNRTMAVDVKFMVSDIRYLCNQIGCHDSHIDDHNRYLRELMGLVDIIKDEVLKLARMNQCSHCQDSPSEEDPVVENFLVTQLVGFSGKPN